MRTLAAYLSISILFITRMALAECKDYRIIDNSESVEVVCADELPTTLKNKQPSEISSIETKKQASISNKFIIDDTWIAVDLGAFEPHAINNSTQIAGDIITSSGNRFAGIWKNGFIERLDGLVVTKSSSAKALNDYGQVIGYRQGVYDDNFQHAVLWDNGIVQELMFDKKEISAITINNKGEVLVLLRHMMLFSISILAPKALQSHA